MKKLVSVIITTYKGSDSLGRALESVLSQTYNNLEIIIVDDNGVGSEENLKTKEVISKFTDKRLKYIEHKTNLNGAVARNTGIKNSTGDFITFLDDDDFMFKERIEKMLKCILNNNKYGAVYSNVILTVDNKIEGQIIADKVLTDKDILLNEMAIGTGSNIFISRYILNKVKKFDETFKRHQDLEFMIRVCEFTDILNLNKNLVIKSTNSNNNMLNYENLKHTKKKYYNKFRENLNKLNKQEIDLFYMKNNEQLYNVAILTKNMKNIEEAKKELEKYRPLNFKEKLIYFIIKKKLFILLNIIRKSKKIKIYDRTINNKLNINSKELEYTISRM